MTIRLTDQVGSERMIAIRLLVQLGYHVVTNLFDGARALQLEAALHHA